ncbi:hypothetical protein MSAN_02132400 [Mycena sanguinolenta]|uniref:Uncharacterized protein n=1 Tax=Mycena sanguinolenta TaxID=230812 RepID=A0A8H6XFP8_9AGAR|nr:hypothetical protein MSAN_02132400 [Mycena sanguinolenta]
MSPLNARAEIVATFIDSLTLEEYHGLCNRNLPQHRGITISPDTGVDLGTIFHCSGDPLKEIPFLQSMQAPLFSDWTTVGGGAGTREVMHNGWTRFQSGDVINNALYHSIISFPRQHTWLSQANHIFRHLNITSNFEDYVVVDGIAFYLNISQPNGDPPEGFLFLCPTEDFRTSSSSLRWPACAAYWSLDPFGIARLGPKDATRLGFPPFELLTRVEGYSWDASVYEGLRQFHQAKGFDPYSQDVARNLGHSLCQLSPQVGALFAHVDGDDVGADSDVSTYRESENLDDSNSNADSASHRNEADMSVLWWPWKFLMTIKLVLILFALFGFHVHF